MLTLFLEFVFAFLYNSLYIFHQLKPLWILFKTFWNPLCLHWRLLFGSWFLVHCNRLLASTIVGLHETGMSYSTLAPKLKDKFKQKCKSSYYLLAPKPMERRVTSHSSNSFTSKQWHIFVCLKITCSFICLYWTPLETRGKERIWCGGCGDVLTSCHHLNARVVKIFQKKCWTYQQQSIN